MDKVFITGGSGFVGAHVVRAYLNEGWEVHVFGPSPKPCLTKVDMAQITFHQGNIASHDDIKQAVKAADPSLVVSLAAYGDTGQGLLASAAANESAALQVNVTGFHNLLSTCLFQKVPRVIWASTLAVFGSSKLYKNGVAYDDSARRPETFYGLTKVLAEDIAGFYQAEHGLTLTGLRLPLVFGPGLWYQGVASKIKEIFESIAEQKAVEISAPAQSIDLMYVKDVARSFIHLTNFNGSLGPIYNLTAYPGSASAIADIVCELHPTSRIKVNAVKSSREYPEANGNKLRQETGFSYKFDLHEACKDYINELSGT